MRPVPAVRSLLTSTAVRFLVVGGLATVVDIALFNVLHVLAGTDPVLAKVVSTVVAGVVAFVGNRSWSFPDGASSGVREQLGPYLAVNTVALAVGLVPIEVARLLGTDGVVAMNLAANVIGLGAATTMRFFAYRRWVFAAQPVVEGPAPRVPAPVG